MLDINLLTLHSLEEYFKQGNDIVLDWDEDGISYALTLCWSIDDRCYKCYASVYRACDDNNCENPEAHTTDDEDYSVCLSNLLTSVSNTFGKTFDNLFMDELRSLKLIKFSIRQIKDVLQYLDEDLLVEGSFDDVVTYINSLKEE